MNARRQWLMGSEHRHPGFGSDVHAVLIFLRSLPERPSREYIGEIYWAWRLIERPRPWCTATMCGRPTQR